MLSIRGGGAFVWGIRVNIYCVEVLSLSKWEHKTRKVEGY